jgi:hypothetical protein
MAATRVTVTIAVAVLGANLSEVERRRTSGMPRGQQRARSTRGLIGSRDASSLSSSSDLAETCGGSLLQDLDDLLRELSAHYDSERISRDVVCRCGLGWLFGLGCCVV